MALFSYKAVSAAGAVSQGTVEAKNLTEATHLLRERQLVVLRINEARNLAKNLLKINIGGLSRKDVVVFSRQLAVMISASVPIVQAMEILHKQTSGTKLRSIAKQIADDIDGGLQMSQAFAKHPKAFSRFYVAMIKSGETSGRLDEIFTYLADQMEKDYDLVSRIRGAMVYPAFIIFGLVSVAGIMLIFVIPRITEILIEAEVELPFLTRMLISTSDFLSNYWYIVLLSIFGLSAGWRYYLKSKIGRVSWDLAKLYIPIFGKIMRKIVIVRMVRSMSTLLKGGVPISVALEITAEVVDNKAYADVLTATIKEVQDGNSMTTAMEKNKLVPEIVVEMISVGEKTGKLEEILEKIGDFYDREVSALVAALTSLIEPLIMVILGVGVALMVAAVILPMFEIANSIN